MILDLKILNIYGTVESGRVRKEGVYSIYDGSPNIEEKEYVVRWNWQVGQTDQVDGETVLEQYRYDSFQRSVPDYMNTAVIYFVGADSVLGPEGYIKLYNKDTGELLHTFTSQDWNNIRYELEEGVKRIQLIMSQPVFDESQMNIYQIKEIDDEAVAQGMSYEDFEAVSNLSTYVRCRNGEENMIVVEKYASVAYDGPYTSMNLKLSPELITNETGKEVKFTICANKEASYCRGWMNGIFKIKLPSDIIQAKIDSISCTNPNVKITSYNLYQDEDTKEWFIDVITENDTPTVYDIEITTILTPNPLMISKQLYTQLYGYNDNYNHFKKSQSDVYDINNNGNTYEQIGVVGKFLQVIAPSGILTAEYVTDYDDKGSVTIAPNIADIEKSNEKRTATINIGLTNNFTRPIENVYLLGNVPYQGNKNFGTENDMGSMFTAAMTGGLNIPDSIKDGVTVYYSEDAEATKDDTDKWVTEENVTDWTKIRRYAIDLGNTSLPKGSTYTITYEVEVPGGLGYNSATFANHIVYYSVVTDNGNIASYASTNKVGIQVVSKYQLELTKNKKMYDDIMVKGAQYTVTTTDANNEPVSKVGTSNSNGTLTIKGLYIGKEYVLKETNTPFNYVQNPEEVRFVVNADDNGEISINVLDGEFKEEPVIGYDENNNLKIIAKTEDEAKYGIVINKVDKNDDGVKGAIFSIKGNGKYTSVSTADNGKATISNLIPGYEYTLTEDRLDGYYLLQEPIKFTVNRNSENGKLELESESEFIKNINIVENDETVNADINITIENEKIPTYNLKIVKVEENLEEENVDNLIRLQGAEYSVTYQDDNYTKEYTTNENGSILLSNLYQFVDGKYLTGEYTIVETKAPEGYSNNAEEIVVKGYKDENDKLVLDIENRDNLVTVKDVIVEGENVTLILQDKPLFELKKVDSETGDPLVASFIIYEVDSEGNVIGYGKDANGEYVGSQNEDGDYIVTTGENGIVKLPLRGGIYKVVEVVYPEGYRKDVDEKYFIIGNQKMVEVEEDLLLGTVEINYIEDLVDLSNDVNSGDDYKNYQVLLMRDLDFNKSEDYRNPESTSYGDLNGDEEVKSIKEELTDTAGSGFTPIGKGYDSPFSGTFDGQEHIVSGLYEKSSNTGLFGTVNDAKIKNLTVEGYATGSNLGGIVGQAFGVQIDNVHNKVSLENGSQTGGIIGAAYSGNVIVSNSSNNAEIKGNGYTGGIIGFTSGAGTSLKIINCVNKREKDDGTFIDINNPSGQMGGIIGISYNDLYIEKCKNEMNITSSGACGIAYMLSGSYTEIIDCENRGNMTGNSASGLVYTSNGDTKVNNFKNYGNINGSNYVSGMIGNAYGDIEARECENYGEIYSDDGYNMGGLVGYGASIIKMYDCKNHSKISNSGNGSGGYIGGLIGYASSSSRDYNEISKCENNGKIQVSGSYIGGIAGYSNSSKISDCENKGEIIVLGGSGPYVGGIVGNSKINAKNIKNSGKITVTLNTPTSVYIGGLIGNGEGNIVESSNSGNIDIIHNLTGTPYIQLGGIVGYHGQGTIKDTYNIGNISAQGGCLNQNFGGITGHEGGSVKNSYNKGNITIDGGISATLQVGGITGELLGNEECVYNTGLIKREIKDVNETINASIYFGGLNGKCYAYEPKNINNSYNAGEIMISYSGSSTGSLVRIGGINGDIGSSYSINNCYNSANIYSYLAGTYRYIGGINGGQTYTTLLQNCYNSGNIVTEGYSTTYEGGISGYSDCVGNITNCYNSGKLTGFGATTGGQYALYLGGLLGNSKVTKINSSVNKGEIVFTGYGESNIGGAIGLLETTGEVLNCSNTGKINGTVYGNGNIGGSIGKIAENMASGTISELNNTGKIDVTTMGYGYIGGIVGTASGVSGEIVLNKNINTGDLKSTTNSPLYIGGIVSVSNIDVINSENSGNIEAVSQALSYTGGICSTTTSDISNCKNTGKIIASSSYPSYSGGIVSISGDTENSPTISNCYNSGSLDITSTSSSVYIGGIIGEQYGTLVNSENSGNVKSTAGSSVIFAGGDTGYLHSNGIISNVKNFGNVEAIPLTNEMSCFVGPIVAYQESDTTVGDCEYLDTIIVNGTIDSAITNTSGTSSSGIEQTDISISTPEIANKTVKDVVSNEYWVEDEEGKLVINYHEENNKIYTINNLQDLVDFKESVDNGETYSGEKVTLMTDINIGEDEELKNRFIGTQSYKPGIGRDSLFAFEGEFDGNGHKISGIGTGYTSWSGYVFNYANHAIIENLGLTNGAKLAYNVYNSNIINCYYDGDSTEFGLIAETAYNCNIDRCFAKGTLHNDNNTSLSGQRGVLIRDASYGTKVKNCYNEMDITIEGEREVNIGGLVGKRRN